MKKINWQNILTYLIIFLATSVLLITCANYAGSVIAKLK